MTIRPLSAPSARTEWYVARYRQTREYESPIHEYRVARNLKLRELALLTDVHEGVISGLANGMMSPLKKDGRLKPSAEKLIKFFKCGVENLFPRYFCSMRNDYLTDDQTLDILGSKWSMTAISDPYDLYSQQLLASAIKSILHGMTSREARVIILRFGLFDQGEHTYEEIGEMLSVSIERIRQIERRGMNRIRHSSRRKKLAPHSTFLIQNPLYSEDSEDSED